MAVPRQTVFGAASSGCADLPRTGTDAHSRGVLHADPHQTSTMKANCEHAVRWRIGPVCTISTTRSGDTAHECKNSEAGALLGYQCESHDCDSCDEKYGKPDVGGPLASSLVRVDIYVRQLVLVPSKSNVAHSGARILILHKCSLGISGSGTPLFGQHLMWGVPPASS